MLSIKEAYIGYKDEHDYDGIKIKSFKNLNPVNAYDIDYVRYIANAFNFLLGRFAYFSKRYNKPAKQVIISDYDLAKNIGCHVKHSSVVLNQLKELFDLEFERTTTYGARSITINKHLIDFLNIYTDEDLEQFITNREITSNELIYAIKHLYKYRVWGITDSKLSIGQKEKKNDYLDRFRNYIHRVVSSNRSSHVRVKFLQENIHLLSEKETKQLNRITEELKSGKLAFYWQMLLVRLEQRITAINRIKSKEIDTTPETPKPINRNNNIKDVAKTAATQKAQRLPEDQYTMAINELTEIVIRWNNMIQDQAIPFVDHLNEQHIQSINQLAKSYSKEEIHQAIKNISNLTHDPKYKHKITFERFLKPQTFNFTKSLSTSYDTDSEWFSDYLKRNGLSEHFNFNTTDIPSFKNLSEANNWLKEVIK